MPTYIVTDPDTGRKVKLTGDSPPTESELNNIFSNMPEPEPTIGDQAIGALESLATVATGAIAVPASGIAGLATSLLTGDPSAGEAVRKGVSDSLTFEGGEESKRQLGAIGDAVQSIDESLIRPAIAGTAGLVDVALNPISNITQGFEPAKTTVRSIREKGLGKSAGDQALDATGSPLIASAIATAPTLIETAAGGLLGRITARNKISKTKAKTKESKRVLDDLESGVIKDSTVQDVTEIIKKGDVEDISAMIDADPEFFRALDELGVSSEPLASFSSRNPQFRDVEQALATVPGNILDPQAKTFISEISQIADNLIQQYGGTIDKAQLGLDFKADSIKHIDNLFEQADEAYSSLKGLIPESERFSVPSTVSFLEDLASKDKLPPKFASILKKLRPVQVKTKGKTGVNPATGQRFDTGTTETIQPKLGRIDLIRKEIGQAIGRGSGQFKDVETGLNKALYSRLTRDQDAIAEGVGGQALATSDLGKSLVKQRKQVEDNLQLLLGKDLNSALNIKVSGAIKNLQKGEVDKFNEVMNAIPKNKREAIALSAMNDVFKGSGVNQQQQL